MRSPRILLKSQQFTPNARRWSGQPGTTGVDYTRSKFGENNSVCESSKKTPLPTIWQTSLWTGSDVKRVSFRQRHSLHHLPTAASVCSQKNDVTWPRNFTRATLSNYPNFREIESSLIHWDDATKKWNHSASFKRPYQCLVLLNHLGSLQLHLADYLVWRRKRFCARYRKLISRNRLIGWFTRHI